MPASVYLRALRVRRLIADAYRALLRRVDLLLLPAGLFASYRLDAPPVEPVGVLIRFTAPFDFISLPAIAVPCGLTAAGLPLGVQLAG